METTLHLDTLAQSLLFIPYALGRRPRNCLVICCLTSHTDVVETNRGGEQARIDSFGDANHLSDSGSPLGPMLVLKIVEETLNDSVRAEALELITEYRSDAVAVCWFGEDLETMVKDTRATAYMMALACSIREQFEYDGVDGSVGTFLTDYQNWVDCEEIAVSNFDPCCDELNELNATNSLHSYEDFNDSQLSAELIYYGCMLGTELGEMSDCCGDAGEIADSTGCGGLGVTHQHISRAVKEQLDSRHHGSKLDKDGYDEECEEDCDEANDSSCSIDELWSQVLSEVLNSDRQIAQLPQFLKPHILAQLIASLRHIPIRDRLIIFAVDAQHRSFSQVNGEQLPDLLSSAVQSRPVPARVYRIIDLLKFLDSISPADDVAALAVMSYLHWWMGNGSSAYITSYTALLRDPSYSLAQLVDYAMKVRLPPPWV
ncbi:hypothetical protein JOD55_001335 [Arcanobacterium pluranimalium]|uniref:DUF4192 family protein n=1 Tax=Arcanobacterium pluranimalium TaxID=108028 RepID=UPI00195A752B|nr:DUF4192 family protein [Arcanobacterium pluranimalium]MBM7825508.1 hypothetical protein [Arcanobacterium pluranimalium]